MEKEEDSLSSTPRLVLFIVTFSMYSRPSLFSTSQTIECPSVHKAPPRSKTVHTACQHQFRFCPSPFCDLLGAHFLLFFYTVPFLVPPPSSALPCPDVPWNAPTTATTSYMSRTFMCTPPMRTFIMVNICRKRICAVNWLCVGPVSKKCALLPTLCCLLFPLVISAELDLTSCFSWGVLVIPWLLMRDFYSLHSHCNANQNNRHRSCGESTTQCCCEART